MRDTLSIVPFFLLSISTSTFAPYISLSLFRVLSLLCFCLCRFFVLSLFYARSLLCFSLSLSTSFSLLYTSLTLTGLFSEEEGRALGASYERSQANEIDVKKKEKDKGRNETRRQARKKRLYDEV
jgi:hypothetical protein